MFRILKENKVTSLLWLTVLIGAISTMTDFPDDMKVQALYRNWVSGEHAVYTLNWYVHVICTYLIGFIFLWGLYLSNVSIIDKWMIIIYLVWDVIGMLSFIYMGWPEPKGMIIGGFAVTGALYFLIKR